MFIVISVLTKDISEGMVFNGKKQEKMIKKIKAESGMIFTLIN